ncbi:uncharacterized protein N7483_008416 [Penicillium malachiteum]|uniref:uncharacterized protein n=1 Tax=Penicillium malachiteum TaxID=1324776 RepID=UPI0025491D7D|nr:uncharacterized protein N7483_008416 [Penicillium malachiteum]KAJ5720482.1 hypothetical protein N7483_008416 [Penicillium malachiteum]
MIRGDEIPNYARSIQQLRLAYYAESLNKETEDIPRGFPVLSPIIDTIATLKNSVSQRVPSLIDSNSETVQKLLQGFQRIREFTSNLLAPLSSSFQPSSQLETDVELSDDYIKTGFLQAFEVLKEGARETMNITIRGAVITIPDFLGDHVRELAEEAAIEAGITRVLAFPLVFPQKNLIWPWNSILDEDVTDYFSSEPWENSLLIDYGVGYFDIATNGRCHMKYPMDILGCQRIAKKLFDRFTSFDGPLKQQVEKGASKPDLYSALWTASQSIRYPSEIDTLEDGDDHYAERPLDLQDWWIGDYETVVLRWEDLEAVEAEYIDELANQFDRTLDCLQGRMNERGERSNPIESVIMLGNRCARSVVKRAIRKSVGEHVRIVGGNSENDKSLSVKAATRYALTLYEMTKMAHCEDSDDQDDSWEYLRRHTEL